MNTIKLTGLVAFILLLASCSQSNQKLIVGRWALAGEDMNSGRRIVFFDNNTAVSLRSGETPRPEDSIRYKLSDDGKTLTTTEKNGKVEELTIVSLSKTDMVLMRKGHDDSLRLKRE